ncbi:MAG: TM2 domain-containing protein [Treponema sp.]|jgi:TM2 domain-containing membrane protein YozV/predicted transcriptional regulator|nr:TM2 domain-containing protein [Treponema sp.]
MYSVGVAYLLWLLSGFGALGFHRFYLGKIPTGILWMCTGGLGMLGSIYDFFTLGSQVREANMRNVFYSDITSARQGKWRYVNNGQARVVNEKESVERVILKLAKENNGVLTASEVALAANISIDNAKKDLDALLRKGIAELRVRKSGALVYTIPELIDKDEELEDI